MRASEFFRKLQFFVILALGSYPVTACIIIFIDPKLLGYMWLFPVVYGALGLLSFALPGKLRLYLGMLGTVLFLLPCGLLMHSNARNIMLTFALGYSALLIWSVRIPGWDVTQELPVGWLGGCFSVLLLGCLLSFYEARLASVALGIRISLFVFVFLAMLSLNRGSLILAAGGRRGFSTAMRHKNVLLTVGMFAIALAVALIPSVFHLIKLIIGLLGQLAEKVADLFPEATLPEVTSSETTEAFSTGEGMDVLYEGLETHRTSQTTYFMMAVIALGVMIPVGGFAMYKLIQAICTGVGRLITGIVAAANAQAEDFYDEITDTRDDAQSQHYRGETGAEKRPASAGKMNPAQQIRHRYRQLSARNPDWKAHHTARENLPEEAAQLYERARYSKHPITRKDAESFKNKTK